MKKLILSIALISFVSCESRMEKEKKESAKHCDSVLDACEEFRVKQKCDCEETFISLGYSKDSAHKKCTEIWK